MGWKELGGFVKRNAGTIAAGAGAVYGAVRGSQAQNNANAMSERQMAQIEREYNEAEPLRIGGMQGMLQQRNPYNMEGVGFDQTNPFARDRGQRSLARSGPQTSAVQTTSGAAPMGRPIMRVGQNNPYDVPDPRRFPEGDASGWRFDEVTGRWTRRA